MLQRDLCSICSKQKVLFDDHSYLRNPDNRLCAWSTVSIGQVSLQKFWSLISFSTVTSFWLVDYFFCGLFLNICMTIWKKDPDSISQFTILKTAQIPAQLQQIIYLLCFLVHQSRMTVRKWILFNIHRDSSPEVELDFQGAYFMVHGIPPDMGAAENRKRHLINKYDMKSITQVQVTWNFKVFTILLPL